MKTISTIFAALLLTSISAFGQGKGIGRETGSWISAYHCIENDAVLSDNSPAKKMACLKNLEKGTKVIGVTWAYNVVDQNICTVFSNLDACQASCLSTSTSSVICKAIEASYGPNDEPACDSGGVFTCARKGKTEPVDAACDKWENCVCNPRGAWEACAGGCVSSTVDGTHDTCKRGVASRG